MAFSSTDIERNREYFRAKLGAVKQKAEVVAAVRAGTPKFALVDTRERKDFDEAHIRGATCVPIGDLEQQMSQFPKDREIVTYCYNDY